MQPVCFCASSRRMDLTVLMLLLPMLQFSSCLSEPRTKDPDVEEKEKAVLTHSFNSTHTLVSHGHEHLRRAGQLDTQLVTPQTSLPFLKESSHQPTRRGNWCAFVHRRLVNMAELSAAEEREVKSDNPCINGDPDCQMLKHQPFSRSTNRQKQKMITALHWKCCPGHGGKNCQETVSLTEEGQSNQEDTKAETAATDASLPDDFDSDSGSGVIPPTSSLPFMDSSSSLAFHQIFAAVMTQLQPVLDGFNHTLDSLSREVKGLSIDLKNLRHEQESMSKTRHVLEEKRGKELDSSFEQMQQIWTKLNSQQNEIEQVVRLQHEHLLHNMTILKGKIDNHINLSHKEIQVSLQSLNKSVEEMRLNHEKLQETSQGDDALSDNDSESQSALETTMWEAISNLDMKVLNNTMELSPLIENSKLLVNIVQKLDHGLRNLSQRLDYATHSSAAHLAEIGLDVAAARVATLKTVNELASNLSTQERDLREFQLDVDNIYQLLQNNEHASTDEICSCKEMSDSLVRLESAVVNVTKFAKENRYALEDVEAKRGLSQWASEAEDLHQGLWSVRESLAFEQVSRKTLNDNLAQLKTSLLDSQKEITGLKGQLIAKEAEIRHLSASFTSLVKDAIRHSEVLEVLLGDEVMEFSSWSNSEQKEFAIPVLLQKMRLMQETIDHHENNLTSLRKGSTQKAQMINDDPVAFTAWSFTTDQQSNAEDHTDTVQDISKREDNEDYSVSDFWSLGKEVEQLANRLSMLEEQPCNCTAVPSGNGVELQRDVRNLQQTLEDHLRTFQNLFRYTEELVSSDGVNLDQLRTMMRKRKKGQNVSKKLETSSMRSQRDLGKK